MDSTSDSSDEDLEKFAVIADIVDSEVAKSSQKVCNGNFQGRSKPQTKPSLRHWQEDEDLAYSTSELITPEFRHHVAKKLSKFLDSNYVCSEDVGLTQNGNLSCPHKCSGIKLLLTSKQSLLHVEESRQQFPGRGINTKNKMNCSSSESETDEEELSRLTEAAVSAHSIIQKVSRNSDSSLDSIVSNESKEKVKRETNRLKRKKEKKKKKKREQSDDDEEEVQKKKKHKKHKEKHKT